MVSRISELATFAIGGNSLIKDKEHETVEDQHNAICETGKHIAGLMEQNCRIVVTHGNGPQVDFNLRYSEIAHEAAVVHTVPLISR